MRTMELLKHSVCHVTIKCKYTPTVSVKMNFMSPFSGLKVLMNDSTLGADPLYFLAGGGLWKPLAKQSVACRK